MNHVVVGSTSDLNKNQIKASIINNKIAGNGLHSLIDGMKGKDFGPESMQHVANCVADYQRYISTVAEADLFIDSGGYNFIKGDLAPYKLYEAIRLYHAFLKHCSDNCDFIFSLDIPYSLGFNNFNTRKNVYEFNKISLQHTIDCIEENTDLREKIFFVHHFKTEKHYEIWQNIKDELNFGKHIKYHAIGGMVSIKEVAKISIAPFVATSYQCLADYENSAFNGEEFRLHFLGISVDYDRFVIAFLERLFQRYLGPSIPVTLTYDTITFKRSAMYRQDHICYFNGNDLLAYDPISVPKSIYKRVYGNDQEIIDQAQQDFWRKAKREPHTNQANMAPLVISSQLAIDRYFEHAIDNANMIDILFDSRNNVHFDYNISQALLGMVKGHEHVFGKDMLPSIKKTLLLVYKFHRWYIDDRSAEKLEQLSLEFINKEIHFPYKLQ